MRESSGEVWRLGCSLGCERGRWKGAVTFPKMMGAWRQNPWTLPLPSSFEISHTPGHNYLVALNRLNLNS